MALLAALEAPPDLPIPEDLSHITMTLRSTQGNLKHIKVGQSLPAVAFPPSSARKGFRVGAWGSSSSKGPFLHGRSSETAPAGLPSLLRVQLPGK